MLSTRSKISTAYIIVEILLGLVALISALLDLFDFRLFLAAFGAFGFTFMLFALMLIGIGGLRLETSFLYDFSSLIKGVNTITSALIVATAVSFLFFRLFLINERWLNLLFGGDYYVTVSGESL